MEHQMQQHLRLVGTIARRRSLGKYLAFCNILIPESTLLAARKPFPDIDNTDTNGHMVDGGTTGTTDQTDNGNDNDDNNEEEEEEEEKHVILRVAFRRSSPSWDTTFDETFPIKASSLPFGATVEMDLVLPPPLPVPTPISTSSMEKEASMSIATTTTSTPTTATTSTTSNSKDAKWEVVRWNLIHHPHVTATARAQGRDLSVPLTNGVLGSGTGTAASGAGGGDDAGAGGGGTGGISCSTYFAARGEEFLKYNQHYTTAKVKKNQGNDETLSNNTENDPVHESAASSSSAATSSSSQSPQLSSPLPKEGEGSHGDKKSKALRATIFASWIIDTFGSDLLSQHNGVLDIAGGKGQLSVELAVVSRCIPCTIVDPVIRGKQQQQQQQTQTQIHKVGRPSCSMIQRLASKQVKRIHNVNGPIPSHVAIYFYAQNDVCLQMVKGASCLLGLHPDECTEDIVDAALACNKPFAIVPCCVFPGFFPLRRLKNGKAVRTHDEFLEYLLEKDDRLKMETLVFRGKNQVIYCK
jgi:hypothetical protein